MPKGTRGGENTKIPQGMRRAVYERYKADGFTNTDIARIHREAEAMREQMRRNQERREREGPRPITSGTYERAMRRTAREVEGWLTGGRGRGRGR